LVAAGLKIGGIIAGLAEFGRAFDPRKSQGVGIVVELVKALGVFFEGKTEEKKSAHPGLGASFAPPSHVKEHTAECHARAKTLNDGECRCDGPMVEVERVVVKSDELRLIDDGDDDEYAFMARLYRLGDGVKKLVSENAFKIGWFLVAVSLGVGLYVFFHASRLLDSRLHDDDDDEEARGGNRGKNKKRRVAPNGKRRNGPRGVRSSFIYYDAADRLVDGVIMHDGKSVDLPADMAQLKKGRWQWSVIQDNGDVVDFDIYVESNVSLHEKLQESLYAKGTNAGVNVSGNRASDGKREQCSYCGSYGHKVENCPASGDVVSLGCHFPCKKQNCEDCDVNGNKSSGKKPVVAPTAAERKAQSEKDKALAAHAKKPLPVPPPKKGEALVAGSPQFDQKPVAHCMGVASSKGKNIAQVLSCWLGTIINKHVYDDCDAIAFGGKSTPKVGIKVLYRSEDCGNGDFMVIDHVDGSPKMGQKVGLPKSYFCVPEDSMKLGFINQVGKFCPGVCLKANEVGATGLQMRNTCSTMPGDCGGPYLSVDGQVVAIHFSAGKKGKDNLGMPITEKFLALQRKN